MDDRLYRSRSDRMIAGVAGGLAEHYDMDPSLVRIGWALVILLTGGLLFLLYIVMAIVVPEEPADGTTAAPASSSTGWSAPPAEAAVAAASAPAPASGDPAPASGQPSPGPTSATAAASAAPMSAHEARRAARRDRGRSDVPLVFGAILVIIGLVAFVGQAFPQIDFDLIWPIGLIVLGGALVVGARRRGSSS